MLSLRLGGAARPLLPSASFSGARPDDARYVSLKAVKSRIVAVQSIEKITKAMKMIAQSKLRGVQKYYAPAKVFADALHSKLDMNRDMPISSELRTKEAIQEYKEEQLDKMLKDAEVITVIAIGSDRGLCGSINSALNRKVRNMIEKFSRKKINIVAVGERSRTGNERSYPNNMRLSATDIARLKNMNFMTASIIMNYALQIPCDKIEFMYNHFLTMISYQTVRFQMPSAAQLFADESWDAYEFEGNQEEIAKDLTEFYMAATLHGFNADAYVAEMSSRMTSMDGASSNASEMIADLTLMHNKTRQAKITAELTDIVTGTISVE